MQRGKLECALNERRGESCIRPYSFLPPRWAITRIAPTKRMKFLCVFKKELRLYFGSFIAYSLATAFLLLTGYFFYTDMVFYDLFGDFMDITASLWNYYFLDLQFVTTGAAGLRWAMVSLAAQIPTARQLCMP